MNLQRVALLCVALSTAIVGQHPPAPTKYTLPVPVKLAQGEVVAVVQTLDVTATSVVMGREIVHRQRLTTESSFRGQAPAADGTLVLDVTTDRAYGSVTPPSGDEVAFDSASPDKLPPSGPDEVGSSLAAKFMKLAGAKLRVSVTADGRIKELKGTDEILSRVGGSDPTVKAILGKMVSVDGVTSLVGLGASQFPKVPVAVGDAWPVEIVLADAPIPLRFNGKTKLDSANAETLATTTMLEVDPASVAGTATRPAAEENAAAKFLRNMRVLSGHQSITAVTSARDGLPVRLRQEAVVEIEMKLPTPSATGEADDLTVVATSRTLVTIERTIPKSESRPRAK